MRRFIALGLAVALAGISFAGSAYAWDQRHNMGPQFHNGRGWNPGGVHGPVWRQEPGWRPGGWIYRPPVIVESPIIVVPEILYPLVVPHCMSQDGYFIHDGPCTPDDFGPVPGQNQGD